MNGFDWIDLISIYTVLCLYCLFIMETYCEATEPFESNLLKWVLILTPIVNIYVVFKNSSELDRIKNEKREREDDE
jgi:hypothetical protein